MDRRIMDTEHLLTSFLFLISAVVNIYLIDLALTKLPHLVPYAVLLLLALVIFFSRSRYRYLDYRVGPDRIRMRHGTFFFVSNREVKRDDVRDVYIVDPYRWRWMKGPNEKLPIYFLYGDGRKWTRIDRPPNRLAETIADKWGIEPIQTSRTRFFRDHIENAMGAGGR